MGRYKDLTGEVFGMLTVIKSAGKNKWGNKLWNCSCSCGGSTTLITGNLTGKVSVKSCGCLNHKKVPLNNIIGKKFGRLTVIKYHKRSHWKCVCDCGNNSIVRGADLKSGNTKSCGCFRVDEMTTHGLSDHPLKGTWKDMIGRCYNKNNKSFKHYGARGITVCFEWRNDFVAFFDWAIKKGWKKGLTIDRIDNDGNYTPENCEFITKSENCRKTRLIHSTNTSGYRGVSLNKASGKYQSYYMLNQKHFHLGHFDTAKEAAMARDKAVVENDIDLPLNFKELRK